MTELIDVELNIKDIEHELYKIIKIIELSKTDVEEYNKKIAIKKTDISRLKEQIKQEDEHLLHITEQSAMMVNLNKTLENNIILQNLQITQAEKSNRNDDNLELRKAEESLRYITSLWNEYEVVYRTMPAANTILDLKEEIKAIDDKISALNEEHAEISKSVKTESRPSFEDLINSIGKLFVENDDVNKEITSLKKLCNEKHLIKNKEINKETKISLPNLFKVNLKIKEKPKTSEKSTKSPLIPSTLSHHTNKHFTESPQNSSKTKPNGDNLPNFTKIDAFVTSNKKEEKSSSNKQSIESLNSSLSKTNDENLLTMSKTDTSFLSLGRREEKTSSNIVVPKKPIFRVNEMRRNDFTISIGDLNCRKAPKLDIERPEPCDSSTKDMNESTEKQNLNVSSIPFKISKNVPTTKTNETKKLENFLHELNNNNSKPKASMELNMSFCVVKPKLAPQYSEKNNFSFTSSIIPPTKRKIPAKIEPITVPKSDSNSKIKKLHDTTFFSDQTKNKQNSDVDSEEKKVETPKSDKSLSSIFDKPGKSTKNNFNLQMTNFNDKQCEESSNGSQFFDDTQVENTQVDNKPKGMILNLFDLNDQKISDNNSDLFSSDSEGGNDWDNKIKSTSFNLF